MAKIEDGDAFISTVLVSVILAFINNSSLMLLNTYLNILYSWSFCINYININIQRTFFSRTTYLCSWVVSVCSNESSTSDLDQLFYQMLLTFECFGTDQGYAVFILYSFWKHYYSCPLLADTSVYVLYTLHSFRVLKKIIRPPKPALNCILGLQKCFSIWLGNWSLRNAFLSSHSSFSVAFLVEYMNIC